MSRVEIRQQLDPSRNTYYAWKKKYGGLDVNDAKRLKSLGDENCRLKRLVANLSLENDAMKDALRKKW